MVEVIAIKTEETVILKVNEIVSIELSNVAFIELAKQLTEFVNPEKTIASWLFDVEGEE